MVNEEIKYDLRILSCFNLLFEIKNMMYSEKTNFSISQEILDDFEKKFYSHLKLICFRAFEGNNQKYLSSTKLIQRIFDLNQSLEEQRDNLIPFIKDSLTTMEKNLMTLYKLVPINLVKNNNNNNISQANNGKNGSGKKNRLDDEKRENINAADEKMEQNFEVVSKEINFEAEPIPPLIEDINDQQIILEGEGGLNELKEDFIDNKAKSLEKIKKKIEETYRNSKVNNLNIVNPNDSLDTIEEVNSVELSSSRVSRGIGGSFLKNKDFSPLVTPKEKGSAITAIESFQPLKTEETPVRIKSVKSVRNPLKKQFQTKRPVVSSENNLVSFFRLILVC